MSVSRDFIDSYSPEAWILEPRKPGLLEPQPALTRPWKAAAVPTSPHCGNITLVFGFHVAKDLLKTLISLLKAGGFFLPPGQEVFQRLMEPDGLVDLRARAGPVKPDTAEVLPGHVG